MLTRPVKDCMRAPAVFVTPETTVAQAARTMQTAGISSVLVRPEPLGILTDRDFRNRVLAAGLGYETPVCQVMTHPVRCLDATAPVFAAVLAMLEDNVHHLPLLEEGRVVGMLTHTDVLRLHASSPFALRRALERLDDVTTMAFYAQEVTHIIEALSRSGLGALRLAQIVSSLNDALVRRFVHLAERELGPPPTPFAWIVCGSEGRSEQMLLTDQDNALVYKDSSPDMHAYFVGLADRVVASLVQAGFPPCPGGYMATNWCDPLTTWQQRLAQWIRLPEPQALLDAAIFCDFRAVAGTLPLEDLEAVLDKARQAPRFMTQMLRTALAWGPSLGWFKRLRSHQGLVDLKQGGIGPLVSLARVSALAAGSRARPTLERLAAAGASGAMLTQENATMLAEIYPWLLDLRLRQQLGAWRAGQPLTQTVRLAALSTLERRHLREAFVVLQAIQADVRARCHIADLA